MTPDIPAFRRLDRRTDDAWAALGRLRGDEQPDAGAVVAEVYGATAVPTAPGVYYSAKIVQVGGVEAEGSAGTFTPLGTDIKVLVVGSQAPVAGDKLVCHRVGRRWAADRMGHTTSGHTVAGCGCTGIPDTLYVRTTRYDSAHDYDLWHDVTLNWYDTSVDTLPWGPIWRPGTKGWFSESPVTTKFYTGPIYYCLMCRPGGGAYQLLLIVRSGTTGYYGPPGPLRSYLTPGVGIYSCNICSPFVTKNAVPTSGSTSLSSSGDMQTFVWVGADSGLTPSKPTFCLKVTDLSSGDTPVSGVTVTYSDGSFGTSTGTTGGDGKFCFSAAVVGAGAVPTSPTKAGYKAIAGTTNGSAVAAVDCTAAGTVTGRSRLVPTTLTAFSFAVYDHATELPISGAAVSVDDGAGHVSSGTTDANGLFTPTGLTLSSTSGHNWTVTVTAPSGYTALAPFSLTVNAANNVQLVYLDPS